MDDDKKVPNTAPIIMIKIGNNLNIQNQGMVDTMESYIVTKIEL